MKLLIVDDEELTRQGIINSLDFNSMGISEIITADDGVNGLRVATNERPDIILCDVRMPRLDGIEMLTKIQAILPDVPAIFMSGYSDKDYLMGAIKLGALSYVEKPIDQKELESAIHRAIETVRRKQRESLSETISTNQAADSLAYYLTTPYSTCKDAVDELFNQFYQHYSADKFKYITTIIVKLESASEAGSELEYIYQSLRSFLSPMHLHIIYSEKRLMHLVYHIYSSSHISDRDINTVCRQLKESFSGFGQYYIAIGDQVNGIENAYQSYESAVILLQSSFFFPACTCLDSALKSQYSYSKKESFDIALPAFQQALVDRNQTAALDSLQLLYSCISNNTRYMPNQIKSAYFNLFNKLFEERKNNMLTPDLSIENRESLMDIMDACFSFDFLHQLLLDKTNLFFADLGNNVSENKTIYLIKNYIAENYANPSLSVKDISDYAHLSVSYLCTFFKNETDNTLNQYITEFRMDKAKQLLADPRNKITEISAKVGYNDGNYFGKSFKKYVGLSPSEYREKVMK